MHQLTAQLRGLFHSLSSEEQTDASERDEPMRRGGGLTAALAQSAKREVERLAQGLCQLSTSGGLSTTATDVSAATREAVQLLDRLSADDEIQAHAQPLVVAAALGTASSEYAEAAGIAVKRAAALLSQERPVALSTVVLPKRLPSPAAAVVAAAPGAGGAEPSPPAQPRPLGVAARRPRPRPRSADELSRVVFDTTAGRAAGRAVESAPERRKRLGLVGIPRNEAKPSRLLSDAASASGDEAKRRRSGGWYSAKAAKGLVLGKQSEAEQTRRQKEERELKRQAQLRRLESAYRARSAGARLPGPGQTRESEGGLEPQTRDVLYFSHHDEAAHHDLGHGSQARGHSPHRGHQVTPALHHSHPHSNGHEEGTLRDIFDRCDTDGDGRVNKRELIKVCRSSPEVARFLGLPQIIRQEGGSREAFESRFQSLDQNGDREITWEEFREFYLVEVLGESSKHHPRSRALGARALALPPQPEPGASIASAEQAKRRPGPTTGSAATRRPASAPFAAAGRRRQASASPGGVAAGARGAPSRRTRPARRPYRGPESAAAKTKSSAAAAKAKAKGTEAVEENVEEEEDACWTEPEVGVRPMLAWAVAESARTRMGLSDGGESLQSSGRWPSEAPRLADRIRSATLERARQARQTMDLDVKQRLQQEDWLLALKAVERRRLRLWFPAEDWRRGCRRLEQAGLAARGALWPYLLNLKTTSQTLGDILETGSPSSFLTAADRRRIGEVLAERRWLRQEAGAGPEPTTSAVPLAVSAGAGAAGGRLSTPWPPHVASAEAIVAEALPTGPASLAPAFRDRPATAGGARGPARPPSRGGESWQPLGPTTPPAYEQATPEQFEQYQELLPTNEGPPTASPPISVEEDEEDQEDEDPESEVDETHEATFGEGPPAARPLRQMPSRGPLQGASVSDASVSGGQTGAAGSEDEDSQDMDGNGSRQSLGSEEQDDTGSERDGSRPKDTLRPPFFASSSSTASPSAPSAADTYVAAVLESTSKALPSGPKLDFEGLDSKLLDDTKSLGRGNDNQRSRSKNQVDLDQDTTAEKVKQEETREKGKDRTTATDKDSEAEASQEVDWEKASQAESEALGRSGGSGAGSSLRDQIAVEQKLSLQSAGSSAVPQKNDLLRPLQQLPPPPQQLQSGFTATQHALRLTSQQAPPPPTETAYNQQAGAASCPLSYQGAASSANLCFQGAGSRPIEVLEEDSIEELLEDSIEELEDEKAAKKVKERGASRDVMREAGGEKTSLSELKVDVKSQKEDEEKDKKPSDKSKPSSSSSSVAVAASAASLGGSLPQASRGGLVSAGVPGVGARPEPLAPEVCLADPEVVVGAVREQVGQLERRSSASAPQAATAAGLDSATGSSAAPQQQQQQQPQQQLPSTTGAALPIAAGVQASASAVAAAAKVSGLPAKPAGVSSSSSSSSSSAGGAAFGLNPVALPGSSGISSQGPSARQQHDSPAATSLPKAVAGGSSNSPPTAVASSSGSGATSATSSISAPLTPTVAPAPSPAIPTTSSALTKAAIVVPPPLSPMQAARSTSSGAVAPRVAGPVPWIGTQNVAVKVSHSNSSLSSAVAVNPLTGGGPKDPCGSPGAQRPGSAGFASGRTPQSEEDGDISSGTSASNSNAWLASPGRSECASLKDMMRHSKHKHMIRKLIPSFPSPEDPHMNHSAPSSTRSLQSNSSSSSACASNDRAMEGDNFTRFTCDLAKKIDKEEEARASMVEQLFRLQQKALEKK
ncbi:unnamed protein product, partial [Polarella glacialis]